MRIGTPEIIVIIIIVIVIAIITRIIRFNRDNTPKDTESSPDMTVQRAEHKKTRIWINTKRMGIASVIIGILLALSAMSIFKWAVQSYIWATILMALGLGLLFLSRKRQ